MFVGQSVGVVALDADVAEVFGLFRFGVLFGCFGRLEHQTLDLEAEMRSFLVKETYEVDHSRHGVAVRDHQVDAACFEHALDFLDHHSSVVK